MTPPRFEPIIIAIDGPAAAGKGTLARRLAQHFNLPYLDTGLLYRAVARRRCPCRPGRLRKRERENEIRKRCVVGSCFFLVV